MQKKIKCQEIRAQFQITPRSKKSQGKVHVGRQGSDKGRRGKESRTADAYRLFRATRSRGQSLALGGRPQFFEWPHDLVAGIPQGGRLTLLSR